MSSLVFREDDPRAADVHALLERHLEWTYQHGPPEDVHALDADGLAAPHVSFFSVRLDGALLGVGALQVLDESHIEIKSMHTVEGSRSRGLGRAMLGHLLDEARRRGYSRVSLETGSMEAFAPARALYASAGFVLCPPFASYRESPNSVYMTLALD